MEGVRQWPGSSPRQFSARQTFLVKLQSMAGDIRGHDVESWWKNRVAYRDTITTAAIQWRMASENFSHASDGARAAAPGGSNEIASDAVGLGQTLLVRVNVLKQQLGALDTERQEARFNFSREETAIGADCRQRVQAEREEATRSARAAAERLEKSKVLVRKAVAAVIFVIILYVLAEY
jgi:hypothetical protein